MCLSLTCPVQRWKLRPDHLDEFVELWAEYDDGSGNIDPKDLEAMLLRSVQADTACPTCTQAYKAGDMEKVKRLQYQLVNSWARKSIAVKTVTSNKGKKTAGVDGVIWDTPELKRTAIANLKPSNIKYVAKPVKRVYIPKRNGKLRPLGIPCIEDRAMQTVWKLALEPIAECTRDVHSYGFRPGRSRQDCQQILW